jgi:hypothetical protein
MTNRDTLRDRLKANRREVQLSGSLRKRLTAYASAATGSSASILSAAAVGATVLAGQPAVADIIIDNNPIQIPAANNRSAFYVPLVINGATQFTFFNVALYLKGGAGARLSLFTGLAGNGVLTGPLRKGAPIGSGGAFGQGSVMAYAQQCSTPNTCTVSSKRGGLWANQSGYLGFEFHSNGGTHFGWAHISVTDGGVGAISGTISEFAYDTVPGQSIEAGQTATPEPGTLGLLALGSLGLAFWRRKKQSV